VRAVRGRTAAEDYAAAKAAARRARGGRAATEAALAEVGRHAGRLAAVRLSDEARGALLDLYARALVGRGRPLGPHDAAEARVDEVRLVVTRTPGVSTTVTGPAGRLELVDLTLTVHVEAGERRATG
jgi:hypothetical protein